ncbi:MAG TPA: hypothetical protein VNO55_05140 [Polyangia bacterium]|nr:hypothetical protein [Polyangia bacterium]
MGKAEDKRAAIVAQQAARELAERAAGKGFTPRTKRKNWGGGGGSFRVPRRGRPPGAPSESTGHAEPAEAAEPAEPSE